MATFGGTTPGAQWQNVGSNVLRGSLANMPQPGRITGLHAYLAGGPTAQQFQMALFEDEGGRPGARRILTNVASMPVSFVPQWVTFVPAATPDLPAASYWLGLGSGAGAGIVYASFRAGGTAYSDNPFTGGIPGAWPSAVSYLDQKMSVYADFTSTDERPDVHILAPVEDEVLSGTYAVLVDASDDIAVQEVELFVDTTNTVLLSDQTEPYSLPLDTTALADGTHILYVRAWDFSGNYRETSVVVTVSNRADVDVPVAEIISVG